MVVSAPVLIWGAGAIGASLGAAFVRAGEQVIFVDTAADHVEAINRDGLTITGPVATCKRAPSCRTTWRAATRAASSP